MKDQDRLKFLQSLKEAEFVELVLLPLLDKMGYERIQVTHGASEYGKDIVFSTPDPLDLVDGRHYLSATVKMYPLSGSVSSSRAMHEVYFQIRQSLTEPFIHPYNGIDIHIDRVYVITPYPITQQAIRSIRGELQLLENRVFLLSGPELLSLIDRFCSDLLTSLPDLETRYLHTLSRRFLETRALGSLSGQEDPRIHEIYTGGDLSETTPDEAQHISFAFPEVSKRKLWPRDVFKTEKFFVILADVGSGKTTLLHKFASDLISERDKDASFGMPILVPLHILPGAAFTGYIQFSRGLEEYIQQREGLESFYIENQAHDTVLLLDGFDELPSSHDQVAKLLSQLADHFPKGVLVTSRPSRIPMELTGYSYYKLNPFDDFSIKTFLSKWFTADSEQKARVTTRIFGDPSIKDFCRNPLMLTLYCILARRHSIDDIPNRKTALYESIAALLLGDWDQSRKIQNRFSAAVKEFTLESLAFRTHKSNEKQFSQRTLVYIIEEILATKNISHSPMAMYDELLYRSSLIRPNITGNLEFSHLSFQEFFCAKHLLRLGDLKRVQHWLYDEWWRNVMTFYFGLKRSMEGVSIPTSGRSRGKGIRLMEFLAEADYTDAATRNKVFRAVGVDILFSGELSRREIDICLRGGMELARTVGSLVQEGKGEANAANYIRLLAAQESEHALQPLLDSTPLLSSLKPEYIISILKDSSYLFSSRAGLSFFQQAIGVYTNKLRHSQRTNPRHHASLLKELKESITCNLETGKIPEHIGIDAVITVVSAAHEIAFSLEETNLINDLRHIIFPGGDKEIAAFLSVRKIGPSVLRQESWETRGDLRRDEQREIAEFWGPAKSAEDLSLRFEMQEASVRSCIILLGWHGGSRAFFDALANLFDEFTRSPGVLAQRCAEFLREVEVIILEKISHSVIHKEAGLEAVDLLIKTGRDVAFTIKDGGTRNKIRGIIFPRGDQEILEYLLERPVWFRGSSEKSAKIGKKERQLIDTFWKKHSNLPAR